ncbi:hypothetical protein SDRG_11286 [Saprolegnia diclina VS20]|uniref:Uncharacterized protein n=1 Tax=Saprolegnia diclina (strain VS20) TaxID=1156394 RepID=T0Q8X4_SAPDV|nr:hypothetical protein SDRG_11286 [Saprolegnia diclina VS20]EQC31101.1 hypothetical protein SDRG_11286 [Saprolegnia diclina VS20]|eukprot:XP_008615540.1 hypothetical protein SDRG_11286 [Saprolegnia diclina VS20]
MKAGDDDEYEAQVEVIAPRSRHRYFRPQVPLYEVVSYDGHFEVRERPQANLAAAAKPRSSTTSASPYKAASKKRPRPQSSHRGVRAVLDERAKTAPAMAKSPRQLQPLAPSPPHHVEEVQHQQRPAEVLDAQVVVREGILASMAKLCARPHLATSPTRLIQLVQLCQRLRQHTMNIVAHHSPSIAPYLTKMATDTNFLQGAPVLLQALGVESLLCNPLLCAVPLTQPELAAYVVFRRPRDRDALLQRLRATNEVDENRLLDALVVLSTAMAAAPPTSIDDDVLDTARAQPSMKLGPKPEFVAAEPCDDDEDDDDGRREPDMTYDDAVSDGEELQSADEDDGATFGTVASLCDAMQADLKSHFGAHSNMWTLAPEHDPVIEPHVARHVNEPHTVVKPRDPPSLESPGAYVLCALLLLIERRDAAAAQVQVVWQNCIRRRRAEAARTRRHAAARTLQRSLRLFSTLSRRCSHEVLDSAVGFVLAAELTRREVASCLEAAVHSVEVQQEVTRCLEALTADVETFHETTRCLDDIVEDAARLLAMRHYALAEAASLQQSERRQMGREDATAASERIRAHVTCLLAELQGRIAAQHATAKTLVDSTLSVSVVAIAQRRCLLAVASQMAQDSVCAATRCMLATALVTRAVSTSVQRIATATDEMRAAAQRHVARTFVTSLVETTVRGLQATAPVVEPALSVPVAPPSAIFLRTVRDVALALTDQSVHVGVVQSYTKRTTAALTHRLLQTSFSRASTLLQWRRLTAATATSVATRAIASLVELERRTVITYSVHRTASVSVKAACACVFGKHARRLQKWYRYWRNIRHLRRVVAHLVHHCTMDALRLVASRHKAASVVSAAVCRFATSQRRWRAASSISEAWRRHRRRCLVRPPAVSFVTRSLSQGVDTMAVQAEAVRVVAKLTRQIECSCHVAQEVTANALVRSALQATARMRLQAAWRMYHRRRRRAHLRARVVSWTTMGLAAVYQSRTERTRRLAALRQRQAARVLARTWRGFWRRRAAQRIQRTFRRHHVRCIYRLECACASRLQTWLRPILYRRRCQRRLQRSARRFIAKKIWSSAKLLAGDTSTYFALWLYRGSAWVSCVLHRKRGLLELNNGTSTYLRRLYAVKRDHDLAALDITNHLVVRETPRTVVLALPTTFNLQAQLQRSQSLSVLNQGKTKPPARSVLDTAVTLSVDDTLQSLLDGRDVNERNALGETPLHLVLTPARGLDDNDARDAMVDFLLEQSADVDARDYDGVTPLMRAAEAGDIRGIARLLEAGASIRAVDNKGYNALHRACAKNQVVTVEFLAHRPALTTASYEGMFPLHMAALLGHASIAVVLQSSASIDVRDGDGRTPLQLAVAAGHASLAACLLEGGADPNARDNFGRVAMHYATDSSHGLEMASLLRSCKANLNAGDARGDTPLHWAAIAGNQKILQHLLNLGCDTSLHNTDWHTALDEATAAGQRGCAELLRRAAPSTRAPRAASSSYIRLHELMDESTDIYSMYLAYDEPYCKSPDDTADEVAVANAQTNAVVDADASGFVVLDSTSVIPVDDESAQETAEHSSVLALHSEMHDGAVTSSKEADCTSGSEATNASGPGVSGPTENAAEMTHTPTTLDACAVEDDPLLACTNVDVSALAPEASANHDVSSSTEHEAAETLAPAEDTTEYDIRIGANDGPITAPLLEEAAAYANEMSYSEYATHDPAYDFASFAAPDAAPYDASQYTGYEASEYALDPASQEAAYDASQYDPSQYAGYEASQYAAYDTSVYDASQYAAYDGSQYSAYDYSQPADYDATQPTPYDAPYDALHPVDDAAYDASQYDASQYTGYDVSQYDASQYAGYGASQYDASQYAGYEASQYGSYGYYENSATAGGASFAEINDEAAPTSYTEDRTYEMDAVSDAYEICIGDDEAAVDTDDDDDYGTAFPAAEDSLFDDKPHLSRASSVEPDKEASPRMQ